MTTDPEFDPFQEARRRQWMWRGLTLLVLLSLATAFWFFANNHAVKIKREEPISQLMSVAPPPPPPPPPKPKEVVKEITPQAAPQQIETPKTVVHDNAVTENAPAQEGADAFNIGTGPGNGMHGSGVAGDMERNLYASYVGRAINSAAQGDSNLNTRVFQVNLRIWLSPQGKIIRVEVISSDGSDQDTQALKTLMASMPSLNPPPQSLLDTQPLHLAMTLRP